MLLPDVIGFQLSDARLMLENAGFFIDRIKTTAPPKEKSDKYDEIYRVIRVNMTGDKKIELLVCKPLQE